MLLENAWETLFILGIILASSLLPSLARQTFSLWWRSQTVALSQAALNAKCLYFSIRYCQPLNASRTLRFGVCQSE